MYIDHIQIEGFRVFDQMEKPAWFVHPEQNFEEARIPKPKLNNVNLLLGINGAGKSTMLKAIALAALGPAVGDAGIRPYRFARRTRGPETTFFEKHCLISADFKTHKQDNSPHKEIRSVCMVERKGDYERLVWARNDEKAWHPVYSDYSDAMFVVGYGANRRVEEPDQSKSRSQFANRAKRVMGLFDENYTLRPLSKWFYKLRYEHRHHHEEVVDIINNLIGRDGFSFTGERANDEEYLFRHKDSIVPFPALSDGYRAYIGWLSDLLFHLHDTNPNARSVRDNHGIVMIDEIDLHLHPRWQMEVLPRLSKEFPNLQIIATTHSPLVVGSLEWMNILVMKTKKNGTAEPIRVKQGVHGLDADQVLLTSLFGLRSTRAQSKVSQLDELTKKAMAGDEDSALELLKQMSEGSDKI